MERESMNESPTQKKTERLKDYIERQKVNLCIKVPHREGNKELNDRKIIQDKSPT